MVINTRAHGVSTEKLATLKTYGIDVRIFPITDLLVDPNNYHSQAVKLHKEIPHSFMPNQYFNTLNAQAHYHLKGYPKPYQIEGMGLDFDSPV